MLLSRACEYGIQALLYLAMRPESSFVSIKEIAEKQNISFHFLGKTLQILTQRGLLVSYKGPHGGVSLAKPAKDITLAEIVEAIDGLDFLDQCVIGLGKCIDNQPCPLHFPWMKIKDEIIKMLTQTSLEYLAKEIRLKKLQLSRLSASR